MFCLLFNRPADLLRILWPLSFLCLQLYMSVHRFGSLRGQRVPSFRLRPEFSIYAHLVSPFCCSRVRTGGLNSKNQINAAVHNFPVLAWRIARVTADWGCG